MLYFNFIVIKWILIRNYLKLTPYSNEIKYLVAYSRPSEWYSNPLPQNDQTQPEHSHMLS